MVPDAPRLAIEGEVFVLTDVVADHERNTIKELLHVPT